MKKSGFTLIELLIIVGIIALMASVILVSLNESRKKARINGAKTTLKSVMTTLVSCGISNGAVSAPVSGNQICSNISNSSWPVLPRGYAYVAGGNYSYACDFEVSTAGDLDDHLACNCISQRCE